MHGYARLRGIDPSAVGLPADPGAVGHEVRVALDRHGLVPKGSLDAVLGSYLTATRAERVSALAAQTGDTAEQLDQGLTVFTHSITGVVQWRPDPYDGPVEFFEPCLRRALPPWRRGRAHNLLARTVRPLIDHP